MSAGIFAAMLFGFIGGMVFTALYAAHHYRRPPRLTNDQIGALIALYDPQGDTTPTYQFARAVEVIARGDRRL